MARRLRNDQAGALYHVMNRGVARRTMFDTSGDYRFFLACLARAVRRGEITVLAYVLMRTHFHLLLRSHGRLSDAMRRIQLRFVRRFNRLHRRDGPLVRGRFLSRRVGDHSYARNVLHYTHENPILAGLCETPQAYPWSSAWIATQERQPKWFSMEAIREHGISRSAGGAADVVAMRARAELVEARLCAPAPDDDMPLDAATPESVLDWMRRKAKLADGARTTLPAVGSRTLLNELDGLIPQTCTVVTPVPGAGTYRTSELLRVGLLRDVCCTSHVEIAAMLDVSVSRTKRLCRLHARCIEHLTQYGELALQVVQSALAKLQDEGI